MWVLELIWAGGLNVESCLVGGDSVVSTQRGFGDDFAGPDPVSDRLSGHPK